MYTVSHALWSVVVTGQGYHAQQTGRELDAVTAQIAAFRAAVANPRMLTRVAGQALHDILVKPIEPALNKAGVKMDKFADSKGTIPELL